MKSTRLVMLLAGVAAALRCFLGLRIRLPSNDGGIYLWASEALTRGDFEAPWSTVFHAGTAHVIALGMLFGLDSYSSAVVTMSLAGALSILLMGAILGALGLREHLLLVVALFAFGFQFTRLPADVYSESFALPCSLAALYLSLRGRPVAASGAAVVGYAFRPEAILALLAPLVLVRRSGRRARDAALILVCGALGVALYALVAARMTGQVAATPKLDFMLPLGPLGALAEGAVAEALSRLAQNLARVPASMASGLDYVVGFLACAGLYSMRKRSLRVAQMCVLWAALHLLVLLAFQVKPRFFLMFAPVLYPLVATLLEDARSSWLRRASLVLTCLALATALLRSGKDLLDPPRQEKRIEVEVGRQFARESAGGAVLSPLPRVMWAAGARPLAPWPWSTAEVLEIAERRGAELRFLVLLASEKVRRAMVGVHTYRRLEQRGARLDIYERL